MREPPSFAEARELDHKVVFVTTWLASAFAVGLFAIGLVGGDQSVLGRSIAPATIALVGWAMLELDRPSVVVQLFVGMAGVAFMVVVGEANGAHDALFGILAMGTTGAVFIRRYVAVFVTSTAIGMAVIGYWHGTTLEAAPRLQTAFGSAATFVFLAWLIVWMKGRWLASQRELRELIQSKDELVASISHELRTPMTTVLGLARELDERFTDFRRTEVEEFISLIVDESGDVANILEDLLVAARADIGTLSLDIHPVELISTIDAVLAALPQNTIDFRDDSAPTEVLADGGRVRQILRNLVVNASRHGGPAARILIERRGATVSVAVCDNGDPISPPERERIFHAYGGHEVSSTVPGSVGLGLTVSREMARLMGGDLVYDHDGTEGSFTLTLPAVPAPGDRSEAEVEVTPLAM
jgi:signal transduction histidine kinase